jgi:hypothetical protein
VECFVGGESHGSYNGDPAPCCARHCCWLPLLKLSLHEECVKHVKKKSCVLERESWKICTWWCSSTSNLRRYMMVHGQTMVGILSQRHGGYSHRAMDYTQFVSSQSCTQVAAVLVLGHLGWRRGQCSKRWPQELRSESLGESWPLDHGYWEGLITHRWFGRSIWICVLSMFKWLFLLLVLWLLC